MLKPTYLSNDYIVSDKGFVLTKQGKQLKPSVNHKGYQIVNLMIDNKRKGVAVHTLVARAFCSGYRKGLTVNHKDGNKQNNHYINLEWITYKEQQDHSINILGNRVDSIYNGNSVSIIGINKYTGEKELSFGCIMDAAKYLEPDADYQKQRQIQNSIWRVLSGHRKSYKNYIWIYKDQG